MEHNSVFVIQIHKWEEWNFIQRIPSSLSGVQGECTQLSKLVQMLIG